YQKVAPLLPFAERIYTLEKPRKRGLAVKGEEVAKEMESIRKQVIAATPQLKKEGLDMKEAMAGYQSVKGLQGILKNYFNFYNGYDPLFTWWVPKTYTGLDSVLNIFANAIRGAGRESTAQKDDG